MVCGSFVRDPGQVCQARGYWLGNAKVALQQVDNLLQGSAVDETVFLESQATDSRCKMHDNRRSSTHPPRSTNEKLNDGRREA